MMQLEWSQAQQRRFEWLLSVLRLADRLFASGLDLRLHQLCCGTCGFAPDTAAESSDRARPV